MQDESGQICDFGPLAIPEGEWVGFTVDHDKSATVTAGAFGWMEDIVQPS